MKKVFIAGGVTFDRIVQLEHFPQPEPQTVFSSAYRETIGSTGAGKALNLARLGFDVTLHTLVGKDEAGAKIREYFTSQPVKMLYHEDLGTETHVNLMDAQGQRISIYSTYATFEPSVDFAALEAPIQNSDFVVLNIINYVRHLIPLAQKNGKKIWSDLHDYDGKSSYYSDFVDGADYLFLSSEKMKDYKTFMQAQIEKGKELVVCTHGKQGASLLAKDGQQIDMPIEPSFQRLDTNGAGDSFFAGFLYGFSNGLDLESCMRMGTLVAGFCIASPQLYGLDLSEETLRSTWLKLYNVNP